MLTNRTLARVMKLTGIVDSSGLPSLGDPESAEANSARKTGGGGECSQLALDVGSGWLVDDLGDSERGSLAILSCISSAVPVNAGELANGIMLMSQTISMALAEVDRRCGHLRGLYRGAHR